MTAEAVVAARRPRPDGTHSADWHTPGWLVGVVAEMLGGIGLDPCADRGHRIPADRHYDGHNLDGLTTDWRAASVFANPPYTNRVIDKWVARFFAQYTAGYYARGVLLVPNATDTAWFRVLWGQADAVVFLYGRVQFEAGAGQKVSSNGGGSVLAYVGGSPRAAITPCIARGKVLLLS